jgi:hypothetical protein
MVIKNVIMNQKESDLPSFFSESHGAAKLKSERSKDLNLAAP